MLVLAAGSFGGYSPDPLQVLYNMTATLLIICVLVWLFASTLLCAIVAHAKGRDPVLWAIAGFVLGIFALIAIAGMPMRDVEAQRARQGAPSRKRICPACDEAVSAYATVCRWCDCELGSLRPEPTSSAPEEA